MDPLALANPDLGDGEGDARIPLLRSTREKAANHHEDEPNQNWDEKNDRTAEIMLVLLFVASMIASRSNEIADAK